jgi:hypothetical protein
MYGLLIALGRDKCVWNSLGSEACEVVESWHHVINEEGWCSYSLLERFGSRPIPRVPLGLVHIKHSGLCFIKLSSLLSGGVIRREMVRNSVIKHPHVDNSWEEVWNAEAGVWEPNKPKLYLSLLQVGAMWPLANYLACVPQITYCNLRTKNLTWGCPREFLDNKAQ